MTTKTCSKCSLTKHSSEFGARSGDQAHLLRSICKACERAIAHRKRTPKFRWDRHLSQSAKAQRRKLKSRYGLNERAFEDLFLIQNGTCAVCHVALIFLPGAAPKARAHVDHNHETKQVRGLLCHACNTALAATNDEPERLERLIAYLRRNNGSA